MILKRGGKRKEKNQPPENFGRLAKEEKSKK